MTLTPVARNGQWWMTGMDTTNTPFPMGRQIFRVATGDAIHWVGFDDSFAEPLIMKACYEPSDADWQRYHPRFVGYMQFMQLTFQGVAFPPLLYSGRLADRQPYATGAQHGYHFVDFMGPADAVLRRPPDDAFDPFYAFNGLLVTGSLGSVTDLGTHPRPNGSLYVPNLIPGNRSLCASITAEVATSLKTEALITRWISQDTLIANIPTTPAALATSEAYRIALDFLMERGDLAGLQNSDLAGEVVGNYVLITLPSDENEPAVLCIYPWVENGASYVRVHLLGDDDLSSLEQDAALQTLDNISQFLQQQGIVMPTLLPAGGRLPGRGTSGLNDSPFGLRPGQFCIALNYWTMAFAWQRYQARSRQSFFQPLSGFRWSVLFEYDPDTRSLQPTTIVQPTAIAGYDFMSPMTQYYAALGDPLLAQQRIDTSNFTRAAMLRDNFAAGSKYRFIDDQGTIVG